MNKFRVANPFGSVSLSKTAVAGVSLICMNTAMAQTTVDIRIALPVEPQTQCPAAGAASTVRGSGSLRDGYTDPSVATNGIYTRVPPDGASQSIILRNPAKIKHPFITLTDGTSYARAREAVVLAEEIYYDGLRRYDAPAPGIPQTQYFTCYFHITVTLPQTYTLPLNGQPAWVIPSTTPILLDQQDWNKIKNPADRTASMEHYANAFAQADAAIALWQRLYANLL